MRIIHATGQMCNQFWIYSNYLADCIENNTKLVIWLPDFDLNKFPAFYSSKYVFIPFYCSSIVSSKYYSLYKKYVNLVFGNKFSLLLIKAFFKIIPGVCFDIVDVTCSKSNYKYKHLPSLLEIMSPENKFIEDVGDVLRKRVDDIQFDLIVGIHIRYGDYRELDNGKYFYSLQQYKIKMHEIVNSFGAQKSIHFFISSNENIDISVFEGLNVFMLPNTDAVMDLIGLSLCDLIVGPPSTYSAWASLYKNTPIYFIEDINKHINLNSFVDIKNEWF